MSETLECGAVTHTTCSECGWGTPDAKREAALWPRLVLWIVPLVVAGVAVAVSVLAPTMGPSGTWHATLLIQPMITRDDLRRMASGEEVIKKNERLTLVPTLLNKYYRDSFQFGDVRYQAMLVPSPPGSESLTLECGWPLHWGSLTIEQRYRNIAAREGPLAAVTYGSRSSTYLDDAAANPYVRTGFHASLFGLSWVLPPERTSGKIVQTLVMLPLFIISFVIALVGGLIARGATSMLLSRRLARRSHMARKARSLVAVMAFLVILLLPSRQTWLKTDVGLTSPSLLPTTTTLQKGGVLTRLSVEELRAFPTMNDADRALAADILDKIGDTPDASSDDVLLAGACMENMPTSTELCGSLRLLFAIMAEHVTFERCPDFGVQEAVTMPPTNAFGFEDGFLTYLHASGVAGVPVLRLGVYPPGVLAGAAICMVPGLIPFLLHRRHVRRRGEMRLKQGECPWCGYPLGTPTP